MLVETGLALILLRDTHHFSALWPDLEPWAEQGYVGFTAVTGGPAVMPFGAGRKLFGTNPIAIATPVMGQAPLVVDFATSVMSQGDVRLAANAGRELPPGVGLGRGGRPTTDAQPRRDENEAFGPRMADLFRDLMMAGANRLPGQRRLERRALADIHGVHISGYVREALNRRAPC